MQQEYCGISMRPEGASSLDSLISGMGLSHLLKYGFVSVHTG